MKNLHSYIYEPIMPLDQNTTFSQFELEYETLTNDIYKTFEKQFIELQARTKKVCKEEEKLLKDYIQTIDKAIKVSKLRLKTPLVLEKRFKDSTEKVYYSSIALKNTLEFTLNGSYEEKEESSDVSYFNVFNLVEIGKEILADMKKQKTISKI